MRIVTILSALLGLAAGAVSAENTPPVLLRNNPLRVDEGSFGAITDSLLLAADAESPPDSITYTVAPDSGGSPPGHGTLWLASLPIGREDTFTQADVDDGLLSYEHDGSETLFDSFVFQVTDPEGAFASDQGHIHFSFGILVTPINDPPAARDTSLVTGRDSTLVSLLPGSDPDSPSLTFSFEANGSLGTGTVLDPTTGAFMYAPLPDTLGIDTLTFRIFDGAALSDLGTVTVDIRNLPPFAFDDSIATSEGFAVACTLRAFDPEDDPLTFRIGEPAPHGNAVVTDSVLGECLYTPDPFWSGSDTFTFLASDGFADSNAGTVVATIRPSISPGRLLITDAGADALLLVDPLRSIQGLLSSGEFLTEPCGVAVESGGDLLVVDTQNGVIRIDPTTGHQTVLSPGENFSGGSGVGPYGITTDASGSILVADTAFGILRVDPGTGETTVVSAGGDFEFPTNVTESEPGGDLYVVDAGDYVGGTGKIIRVDPVTGFQTVLSSGGLLNVPVGIGLEHGGNLLVTCADTTLTGAEDRVVRIEPGTGTQTAVSTGGLLAYPSGLAITAAGRVYTVGYLAPRVVEIDPVSGSQSIVFSGGELEVPYCLTAIPGTPVAIAEPWGSREHLHLASAPNPFRGSASVRFSLERSGRARLRAYDVLGRVIAVLVDGNLPAGRHDVAWTPPRLPSGMYFLRLETDLRVEAVKVTLCR